jgi:hypothetical protein
MINLICPTRGRPDKMKRMWESAKATAYAPEQIRLVLGIDEDQELLHYASKPQSAVMYVLKDHGIVYGINRMVHSLMQDHHNKLFMIAPDDTIFTTPHWDKALTDHYNALENKAHVYCLRDSRDVDGTPHPVITREYVSMMGYFFPPIFLHWYVDTWTSDIAKACGIFTHLKDYELVHDKPSDRGKLDDTHYRPRARGWHERDSFVNVTCQNFKAVETQRLRLQMQQALGLREHVD